MLARGPPPGHPKYNMSPLPPPSKELSQSPAKQGWKSRVPWKTGPPKEFESNREGPTMLPAEGANGIPPLLSFKKPDVLEYQPKQMGSLAYACSSVQGMRPSQQDTHIALRPLYLSAEGPVNIFGIFDGHGGVESGKLVSNFLKENMPGAVRKALEAAPGDRKSVRHALKQAFRDVDTSFLQSPQGDVDAGSCAIVVVIKGSTLYCANTGDSRAVLLRRKEGTSEWGYVQLSSDQTPERPDEMIRIHHAGGTVTDGRVMGRLGVSRAFGQMRYKDPKKLVISDPEVMSIDLNQDDNLLLLACDGLWDVFKSKDASNMIYTLQGQGMDLPTIAKAMTSEALDRGSTDNISVMLVDLKSWDSVLRSASRALSNVPLSQGSLRHKSQIGKGGSILSSFSSALSRSTLGLMSSLSSRASRNTPVSQYNCQMQMPQPQNGNWMYSTGRMNVGKGQNTQQYPNQREMHPQSLFDTSWDHGETMDEELRSAIKNHDQY